MDPESTKPGKSIRAAEYIRMSTEHQRYSISNQSAAIREYAAGNGFAIVRSYTDSGKSGLTLSGRAALKQLLDDVQSGASDYELVLVFDISRWGRFQDTDESAYYEFTCRRAGIAVHYCAEPFPNDGSPLSAIIKSLKRAMAGEYSRELSAKTFAGQSRLVALGYHIGGAPGYGLRRQLCGESGAPKTTMERGQYKGIQSERTVLVPGPPAEVQIVRWIFDTFVSGEMDEGQIACALNENGSVTAEGGAWSPQYVLKILRRERYVGVNMWNAYSYKLNGPRARNPGDKVIRVEGALTPIVPRSLFDAAQAAIAWRQRQEPREEMLEKLRGLYQRHGFLTASLVAEVLGTAAARQFDRRFGSCALAAHEAGVPLSRDRRYANRNKELRRARARIETTIITGVQKRGGNVSRQGRFLRVNGELNIAVVAMRYYPNPIEEWKRYVRTDRAADMIVAARMNPGYKSVRDFCVLPSQEIATDTLRLSQRRDRLLDCYRFDDLCEFFDLIEPAELAAAYDFPRTGAAPTANHPPLKISLHHIEAE